MRIVAVTVMSAVCTCAAYGQTGVFVPELAHCDTLVGQFLDTHDIPGATVAISKDGKLMYSRGFGYANLAETETATPHHMMRIASISKPITSIAIMKMIEDGQLSLSDKVFGTNGVFTNNAYFNNASVTDSRLFDITIQHLLEHSGGWDRDVPCTSSPTHPYPWTFNHCDPIAFPLHVTNTFGESNPVSEQALVKFLMEKGLEFTPGSQYAYSNIGYLALGLVIEEISGLSYEQYVKNNILDPLNIVDMHMAKNLLPDKREREVEYTGNGYTTLSAYGDGNYVPWEYGGFSIEAMDAHGGWIASARDLVRLLGAVDQFSTSPDILSAASITTMTTPGVVPYYAKGWAVNSNNNWWHTGALDGSATIWVRANSGYNWALLLNKRQIGSQANAFWSDFDGLTWNCLIQASSFPSHDLFDVPVLGASGLTITSTNNNSFNISWTSGDGDKRLLIASESNPVISFPVDGSNYAADTVFGSGSEIGDGEYVVYAGTGNNVNVTGLDASLTYHFRLIEFNQNATGGNHALYQPSSQLQGSGTTLPAAQCNGKTITVDLNLGQTTGPGDDVVLGTPFDDVIRGKGGNDTICGMGGNDFIHGNSGDDWIDGGTGVDNLRGGQGADTIYTGTGATVGSGSRAFGGYHDDVIYGGPDDDDLRGGRGNDVIYGDDGDDKITGNEDDDTLFGEAGNDELKGGNGENDELSGGPGSDSLNGGAGVNDQCVGGGDAGDTQTNCEVNSSS